jgi:pyoverdine/dityrosine biosynthesis protein Dit1
MGKKQVNTVTKTTIDTITVTKQFTKFTTGDKIPFKILDTIYKQNYDTTYIIKDYNQAKEFTDSIRQDSNLFVIRDTISQNKIIGRSFKAKIQEKTITITNNIQAKPKSALYLGIRSDLSEDMSRVNYNISLSFKTRQRGLFSVGYGMSGYSVGYAIKL